MIAQQYADIVHSTAAASSEQSRGWNSDGYQSGSSDLTTTLVGEVLLESQHSKI
jgi:hypothetical protein